MLNSYFLDALFCNKFACYDIFSLTMSIKINKSITKKYNFHSINFLFISPVIRDVEMIWRLQPYFSFAMQHQISFIACALTICCSEFGDFWNRPKLESRVGIYQNRNQNQNNAELRFFKYLILLYICVLRFFSLTVSIKITFNQRIYFSLVNSL